MKMEITEKLKFIGCEIIYREACRLAAESPYRIDLEFLPKGLHNLPTAEMRSRLQAVVDSVGPEKGYKAILLGYARCNNGLARLAARAVPLVIPKAHDCITFFFGGRAAYKEYFDAQPGTYFLTTGWCERDNPEVEGSRDVMDQLGLSMTYDEMVEKYGKENADYIRETLGDGLKNYSRLCYIEMGVGDEGVFVKSARQFADEKGWTFEQRPGDWSLFEKLFYGKWDGDFLVVQPGKTIAARNDDEVLGLGE